MQNPKMQYILKGFSRISEFRVFAFEDAGDSTHRAFTVRTDLALTRRYGIRLQELPLLCRAILEQRQDVEEQQSFTYGEADMRLHADDAAARAEAARHRRGPRRPASSNTGIAWRTTPR